MDKTKNCSWALKLNMAVIFHQYGKIIATCRISMATSLWQSSWQWQSFCNGNTRFHGNYFVNGNSFDNGNRRFHGNATSIQMAVPFKMQLAVMNEPGIAACQLGAHIFTNIVIWNGKLVNFANRADSRTYIWPLLFFFCLLNSWPQSSHWIVLILPRTTQTQTIQPEHNILTVSNSIYLYLHQSIHLF